MRLLFTLSALLFLIDTSGQSKTRLPVWTFNTTDTKVFGLSVGYTTTEKIQNVTSNGVRFELIGFGILLPLIPDSPLSNSDSIHNDVMNDPYSEKINGINLSPLGAWCDCKVNGLNLYGVGSITRQVNGVTAGFVMNFTEIQNGIQMAYMGNWTYHLNGIQLALMGNNNNGIVRGVQIATFNTTRDLRGVQIGVINKSTSVKGLQIGIWNVNEKRKLPILNF